MLIPQVAQALSISASMVFDPTAPQPHIHILTCPIPLPNTRPCIAQELVHVRGTAIVLSPKAALEHPEGPYEAMKKQRPTILHWIGLVELVHVNCTVHRCP